MLVEPHRSVLAPRWGACFLLVDTLHPYELEGRKLPGWRQLTDDERARLATRDRALLTQEEIERGPRYLVWTMRPSNKGGLKMPGLNAQWAASNAQRQGVAGGAVEFDFSGDFLNMKRPASFLVPIVERDGRHMYTSLTSKGQLLIFDIKLKKEIASSMLGASGLTAVNVWKVPNQMIVASTNKGITTLKIFEGSKSVGEVKLDYLYQVTRIRRSSAMHRSSMQRSDSARTSVAMRDTSADASPKTQKDVSKESGSATSNRRSAEAWRGSKMRLSRESIQSGGPRVLNVRYIFHASNDQAIVIVEPVSAEHGPTAKIVDMELGQVVDVDVYGGGPPTFDDDREDDEQLEDFATKRLDAAAQHLKVDKLIQATTLDLKVNGKSQRFLVCMYDSNRLTQFNLQDNELHEVMLVEESADVRKRWDFPITFAALPNTYCNDTYHLVATYQSSMIRWWQVGMTSGKMLSHATLNAAVTHLTMFEWTPPQSSSTVPSQLEKPSGAPGGFKSRRSHFSLPASKDKETGSASPERHRHASVRVVTDKPEEQRHVKTPQSQHKGGTHGGLGSPLRKRSTVKSHRSSLSSRMHRHSLGSQLSASGGLLAHSVTDDFLVNKDQSCLCIIAFDVVGSLPIFIARGGRIGKVYTCNDHFVDRGTKVDQLRCDGDTIAIQLSNGDVRHMEFFFEDQTISMKAVPLDLPS